MHNDALGNPVILGNTYGYTTSSSGITNVVIGQALKLTEKYVTIEVKTRTQYLYGERCNHQYVDHKPTASVYSCNLFPIQS